MNHLRITPSVLSIPAGRDPRRLITRVLVGAASLSLGSVLVGGVAHGAEPVHRKANCDTQCVVAFADSDGDGASDLHELYAGTDPFNAESRPDAELNALLTEDGTLRQVRLGVDGPVFVTVIADLNVQVDLEATPDGVDVVTTELVDLTGKPLTTNHHGIDAAGAGVDVAALVKTLSRDPGAAVDLGSSTPALPTEKLEIPPDEKSLYSEEDPDDPPEPDESPDDAGGGEEGGSGEEEVSKDPQKWEDVQKRNAEKAAAAKEAEEKAKKTNAYQEKRKSSCWFFCDSPDGGSYSDPDAGGSGTIDTSAPYTPPVRLQTAPIDVVRDGAEPIEQPTGPPTNQNNDPTVSDPDGTGDGNDTIALAPGVQPGRPGTAIAPIDPKPGTEDGTLFPLPGGRP